MMAYNQYSAPTASQLKSQPNNVVYLKKNPDGSVTKYYPDNSKSTNVSQTKLDTKSQQTIKKDASFTSGNTTYNPATKSLDTFNPNQSAFNQKNTASSFFPTTIKTTNTPQPQPLAINSYKPLSNEESKKSYEQGYGKEFGLPRTKEEAGSPFSSSFIGSKSNKDTGFGNVNYSPTVSGRGTIISIPQSPRVLSEYSKIDINKQAIGNTGEFAVNLILPPGMYDTIKQGNTYSNEPNIDYKKVTPESQIVGGIQAGLYIIPSSLGVRSIEKGIVKTEIDELSKSPIIMDTKQFQYNNGNIIRATGYQKYGGLTTEYNLIGKAYTSENGNFIMPSGKVVTKTYGNLGWDITGSNSKIFGSSIGNVGSKGISFNIGDSGQFYGSISKATYEPISSTSAIYNDKTLNSFPQSLKNNIKVGGDYQTGFYGSEIYAKDESTFFTKTGKKADIYLENARPQNMKVSDVTSYGRTKVTGFKGVETTYDFSSSTGSNYKTTIPNQVQVPKSISDISSSQTFDLAKSNVQSSLTSQIKSNSFPVSINTGQITTQKYNTKLNYGLQSIQSPKVDTKTNSINYTKTLTIPRVESKQRVTTIPSITPTTTTTTIPKITTNTITTQTTTPKFTNPTPNITSNINITPKFDIPIVPWFPSGSLDFGGSSKRKRGKRRYKYTPSYEALIFNIKGKMPKGTETGARIRPITKGYSFAFNKPKFKFQRR